MMSSFFKTAYKFGLIEREFLENKKPVISFKNNPEFDTSKIEIALD